MQRETEEEPRTIIKHTSDFAFKYNDKAEVVYASGNVQRIFGYDIKEPFTLEYSYREPNQRKLWKHIKMIFEKGVPNNESYELEVRDVWVKCTGWRCLKLSTLIRKNQNISGIA